MKFVGPCLGIALLLCLHSGEFQESGIIQAGGGISVEARRGSFYTKFEMDGPSTIVSRYGGTEYWLVVNDSRECHNFHIHQMKFTVIDADVKVDADGDRTSSDQCRGDRHLVPRSRRTVSTTTTRCHLVRACCSG